MTTERQLIEKTFYETFMEENQTKEPIQVLGEAYFEEQKKDISSDLSAIRFAQGELYFHYKDYESAIFKWENIRNEREPWAKKNMADAYFELGLLPTAEDVYKSIVTDDMTLNTEVSLQLFSLYIVSGKLDRASQVIKETVAFNPDYPNVTSLARAFFEENHDGSSMVELASNEAIRLQSVQWYDVLQDYMVNGITKMMDPAYFEFTLLTLAKIDSVRFEKLSAACWNNYKVDDSHIAWVVVINRIIAAIERENIGSWSKLSQLYKESYLSLINGSHLLKEISAIIPNLLTNWLKVSDSKGALAASAAIVSWNEMFPSTLAASTLYEAENLLLELEQDSNGFEEVVMLTDEILDWAGKHNLQVAEPLKWMIYESKKKDSCLRLFVTGTSESGKSSVINSIIGSDVLGEENSSVIMIENDENIEILEITEGDVQNVERIEDTPSFRQQRSFHVKLPSAFLRQRQLSIIDTPNLSTKNEFFHFLHAADGLLFVLNANTPFTIKEQDALKQIRRELPHLPIHFLINKMDAVYDERQAAHIDDVTLEKIKLFEPEAKVFAYAPHYNSNGPLDDFGQFIFTHFSRQRSRASQTAHLLYFIREMILYLLNQRLEKENELVDSIKWNEEMLAKLNGAINQIGDMETEKVRMLTKSYQEIKGEMKAELLVKIPQLLRECSAFIKEDSNFAKLHIELNDEMNNRIQKYLQDTVLPEYFNSTQKWIGDCSEEFKGVQSFIDEMCESFNALYDMEKLKLECDFKVLDDWRRDADRMTSGISWEKMNILLRFTPSQFLLKSAGKLLGVLPQNNTILYNRYKQFVETEDYQETAKLVAARFLRQFELFERSMERDISIFFRTPLSVLGQTVEETREEIAANERELEIMRQNPEWYQDPLTLFELKLRQYEWLNQKESKIPV